VPVNNFLDSYGMTMSSSGSFADLIELKTALPVLFELIVHAYTVSICGTFVVGVVGGVGAFIASFFCEHIPLGGGPKDGPEEGPKDGPKKEGPKDAPL
jgi:hypothetical protein